VCFKVGHDWLKSVAHVYLGDMDLDRIKNLGIMFLAGSAMRVDTSYIRCKFYTSCSGILSSIVAHWKRWIATKDKTTLKEYKHVRNQVKQETVKLTAI